MSCQQNPCLGTDGGLHSFGVPIHILTTARLRSIFLLPDTVTWHATDMLRLDITAAGTATAPLLATHGHAGCVPPLVTPRGRSTYTPTEEYEPATMPAPWWSPRAFELYILRTSRKA